MFPILNNLYCNHMPLFNILMFKNKALHPFMVGNGENMHRNNTRSFKNV
jgi:hypothetical protein